MRHISFTITADVSEEHRHESRVEASVWVALPHPCGHRQAESARLPQDHQAPHGFRVHQKAFGEQLLLFG